MRFTQETPWLMLNPRDNMNFIRWSISICSNQKGLVFWQDMVYTYGYDGHISRRALRYFHFEKLF